MNKFNWKEKDYETHKLYDAYYGKVWLGWIQIDDNWNKWVWEQKENIIMSIDCIYEVYKKLKELEEVTSSDSSQD